MSFPRETTRTHGRLSAAAIDIINQSKSAPQDRTLSTSQIKPSISSPLLQHISESHDTPETDHSQSTFTGPQSTLDASPPKMSPYSEWSSAGQSVTFERKSHPPPAPMPVFPNLARLSTPNETTTMRTPGESLPTSMSQSGLVNVGDSSHHSRKTLTINNTSAPSIYRLSSYAARPPLPTSLTSSPSSTSLLSFYSPPSSASPSLTSSHHTNQLRRSRRSSLPSLALPSHSHHSFNLPGSHTHTTSTTSLLGHPSTHSASSASLLSTPSTTNLLRLPSSSNLPSSASSSALLPLPSSIPSSSHSSSSLLPSPSYATLSPSASSASLSSALNNHPPTQPSLHLLQRVERFLRTRLKIIDIEQEGITQPKHSTIDSHQRHVGSGGSGRSGGGGGGGGVKKNKNTNGLSKPQSHNQHNQYNQLSGVTDCPSSTPSSSSTSSSTTLNSTTTTFPLSPITHHPSLHEEAIPSSVHRAQEYLCLAETSTATLALHRERALVHAQALRMLTPGLPTFSPLLHSIASSVDSHATASSETATSLFEAIQALSTELQVLYSTDLADISSEEFDPNHHSFPVQSPTTPPLSSSTTVQPSPSSSPSTTTPTATIPTSLTQQLRLKLRRAEALQAQVTAECAKATEARMRLESECDQLKESLRRLEERNDELEKEKAELKEAVEDGKDIQRVSVNVVNAVRRRDVVIGELTEREKEDRRRIIELERERDVWKRWGEREREKRRQRESLLDVYRSKLLQFQQAGGEKDDELDKLLFEEVKSESEGSDYEHQDAMIEIVPQRKAAIQGNNTHDEDVNEAEEEEEDIYSCSDGTTKKIGERDSKTTGEVM